MKYTGHERGDGDLDYMHARYYSPAMGCFLSVDPAWESAGLQTPQTWNRYAYVRERRRHLGSERGGSQRHQHQVVGEDGETTTPRIKKMSPDPEAVGPHTSFKRSAETDRVSGHVTYDADGNPTKRFGG